MRIIGVHGIRVTDGGAGTLRGLLELLEQDGHEVDLLDYGRVRTYSARWRTAGAAAELDRLNPDACIAHSHGNNVVYEYLRQGGTLRAHVAYQPAMRRTAVWPPTVRRILVLHNPRDWVLALGKAFTLVNPVSWFAPHPFGVAGMGGFNGNDPRMTHINARALDVGWKHSYIHDAPWLWADAIGSWLRAGD